MIKFSAPKHSQGPLKISWNLERQLREHLITCLSDTETGHAQKAKYLLDRLNEAKKGKR
jgi:hypothetical protein